MTHWHSLNLGDAMLADEPIAEIAAAFQKAFNAAGNPPDMAVFTRHESEGRLHCEVMAYFSPAAHEAAKKLGAQPCPPPARDGLGLLAGSPNAWIALFPGSNT